MLISCKSISSQATPEPESDVEIRIRPWAWETITTKGEPTPRHEAGLVAFKDQLYLMGGRRINPTSVFNPANNTWTEKSPSPIEIHHFQPVVYKDAIYIIGAMTGGWPNETPLEKVLIYYPEKDEYIYSHDIPEHRRRGGAGVVVYEEKIYVVGGITNGHMNGFQPWLDEYNPETGEWKTLADAPFPRDHFQAVVSGDKLYAFAGRTTSKISNQDMALTLSHGNIYDFKTKMWEPVTNSLQIPTGRAGNFVFERNEKIFVGGGESTTQVSAHKEVEMFDPANGTWSRGPALQQGRHGTGFAVIGDYVYTASGCGNRGGEPELTTIERLKLPIRTRRIKLPTLSTEDDTDVYGKWHTVTLSFKGEYTSETANKSPFLNYRLNVEFRHADTKKVIRGFYAADGNAAQTSATEGAIWKVRFTPDEIGKWTYTATLQKGDSIALSDDLSIGEIIPLKDAEGNFVVIPSYREGADFRANGRLSIKDGYFYFPDTDQYFLKVGTNSPENLLGYVGFDDTYRILAEAREGEAAAPENIHEYAPHLKDWKTGDPTWKDGKGKSIVGAINYLASKGMNSEYFLVLNILGDGKDVWPYNKPDDFTRFDVSKLAQWEILFQHMQAKGILLHMVLQETENETMLDNGDTGPLRQLYFRELIARFGHHLGLVWNLGEENGPADWSPIGQDDAQRKAMTNFLKQTDPYQHPVLLHTHAHDPLRQDILDDIVGFEKLDGLSLQQADREHTARDISSIKKQAAATGHEWLITMDEIGKWYQGALTDTADANHPTLTHYVLWGTLLSGGAGVEWYFGAKHPNNDLTSENWRLRDQLWDITNNAKVFFQKYLPFWEMRPNHDLIEGEETYCFYKPNEIYTIYLPKRKRGQLDLSKATGEFTVSWYDPLSGGALQNGSVEVLSGGDLRSLGNPPDMENKDWVVLLKKN